MKIEGLMPIDPDQLEEVIEQLSAKLTEAQTALTKRREEDNELTAYKVAFVTLPCPSFNPMDQVEDWDTVTVGDVLGVYRRVAGVETPITSDLVQFSTMPLSAFVARMRRIKA